MGAVLGKASPFQLLIIAFFELIFYSCNEALNIHVFMAADIGGSMIIHTFGAYFGLAVSVMLFTKKAADHEKNSSVYHSDLFSMIGITIVHTHTLCVCVYTIVYSMDLYMQMWVTYIIHMRLSSLGLVVLKFMHSLLDCLCMCVSVCVCACTNLLWRAYVCRNSRIRCFLLSMLLQGHCFCGCSGRVSMEYWPLGMPRLEP